jgi:hypothetical protein
MTIPSAFQRQLDEEFGGRFRVRWSEKRKTFQVEYKVERGQALEPPPIDENGRFDTYDDDYIRARDGYDFIVEVTSGDRMACPKDGLTIRLTPMQMKEHRCDYCTLKGRDGRVSVVYFPLNHILIEHLRFIDPMNGGQKRVRDLARRRRAERETQQFNDAMSYLDDVNREFFPSFYGIKQVGYGD